MVLGSKKCIAWGYVGYITTNHRLEEVKIILVGEASSGESCLRKFCGGDILL